MWYNNSEFLILYDQNKETAEESMKITLHIIRESLGD